MKDILVAIGIFSLVLLLICGPAAVVMYGLYQIVKLLT